MGRSFIRIRRGAGEFEKSRRKERKARERCENRVPPGTAGKKKILQTVEAARDEVEQTETEKNERYVDRNVEIAGIRLGEGRPPDVGVREIPAKSKRIFFYDKCRLMRVSKSFVEELSKLPDQFVGHEGHEDLAPAVSSLLDRKFHISTVARAFVIRVQEQNILSNFHYKSFRNQDHVPTR